MAMNCMKIRSTSFKVLASTVIGICSLSSQANAVLLLELNPDQNGDWVFRLTGSHSGSGVSFYNNLANNSNWNGTQGGNVTSVTIDSVEQFSLSGHMNQSVSDPIDNGDGVVVGDTNLVGFHFDTSRVILKFDDAFGASISDFASANFDETVILKPSDKDSFTTVWNDGSYTNGEFTFTISSTVIPEPSNVTLIAGTLALGFVALRRRWNKL